MAIVKVRIYQGRNWDDKKLVHTNYIQVDRLKNLTAKKAGQILANNYPDFDSRIVRNGLLKTDEGFLATRTPTPTDKCEYHFVWELALLAEEVDMT